MEASAPDYSLERCISRHENKRGLFFKYEELSPAMASHMSTFAGGVSDPALAHVHCFGYIARGNDLVKQAFEASGGGSVPEAGESDIAIMKDRIEATRWDMQDIQAILFGRPLSFSYQQIWDLATIIINHKRQTLMTVHLP